VEGVLIKKDFFKVDSKLSANSGVSQLDGFRCLADVFSGTEETKINEIFSGTRNYTLDEDNIEHIFISNQAINLSCLDDLEGIFLKDQDKILNFLNAHPVLKNYILKTKKVINKYFSDSKLEAELIADFGFEENINDQVLFINITTDKTPKEALNLLGKVDKEIDDLGVDYRFFNTNLNFKL